MKKLILCVLFGLFFMGSLVSQPRNIGLRLGFNQEISYQHYIGGKRSNFLQIDAGSYYASGLQISVTHNWITSTENGNFSFYGGFGIGAGFNWKDNDLYATALWDKSNPDYKKKYNSIDRWYVRRYFFAGVLGQAGIEYKFDGVPLAISLDYRPMAGFDFGKRWYPNRIGNEYSSKLGVMFHTSGLWDFGFSIRYVF